MSINEKLAKVQGELKAPKSQYNSFGKYNYRSAEDILSAAKPLCIANGLLLTLSDCITEIGGRIYVTATAMVRDTETDSEPITVTASAREAAEKKGMDESQITGTASSYARKYALNGLFAIDDTKDADTDEYGEQTGRDKGNNTPALICADCGKVVKAKGDWTAQRIADMNSKRFGRILCANCGAAENKKLKGE
jgi:hypothetical protein